MFKEKSLVGFPKNGNNPFKQPFLLSGQAPPPPPQGFHLIQRNGDAIIQRDGGFILLREEPPGNLIQKNGDLIIQKNGDSILLK